MKATLKAVLATSLLLAPAAFAVKVPIPVEGATLNVSVQVQTQALINESGSPNGKDLSYDIFVRRTRLLANGDINQNFSYLLQVDNANFGKFGNFTGRAIIQDAWIGWAPTGITGGNVLYIDAGLLLIPISHHLLESTTNFITADVHTDEFRFPGNGFPALRETGIQLRGWWLDKKIGFRGGVYEGYAPVLQAAPPLGTGAAGQCSATGAGCITPKRYPQFAGFVNFDIIGSEEGGWLYGAYKWAKDPVLSVGVSGVYQAEAIRNTGIDATTGDSANQRLASADVYLNLPMSEAAELVVEATGYLNGNGSGNANTGTGFFVDAGYRFGFVAPYASFSYFQSTTDCVGMNLTTAQRNTCNLSVQTANSRNWKAGLNFFFNKNLNHLNLEFQVNHGQSAYGPQSITAGTAGYAPPLPGGGTAGAQNTNLRVQAQKSFLAHWALLF
jgi:hypothetical protein